jgi:peroxiredoxin Q/BCP
MPEPPAPGDRAPDFTLPSTAGDVSLAAILGDGQRLVLAFFFEAGTPSCETEIAMLRDSYEMIREFGAEVIAVSADTAEAQAAFAQRLGGVPFPLASDASLDAARAYGVVDPDDAGRSRRAVFVIERDGTVMRTIVPFQPQHLAHVEAIFAALGAE